MPAPFFLTIPTAGTWQLVDYRDAVRSGPVAADGTCTLTQDAVPGDELWLVTRAVISCSGTSTTTPSVRLYLDQASQQYLRSGTAEGFFDEADYPGDGLLVPSGRSLIAVWSGAPAGATASFQIQYRVLRQGG